MDGRSRASLSWLSVLVGRVDETVHTVQEQKAKSKFDFKVSAGRVKEIHSIHMFFLGDESSSVAAPSETMLFPKLNIITVN
jgi:hypothetical protein